MQAFNEKVVYENPLLSLRIFQTNRNQHLSTNWHYHKQLELLYIAKGKLDFYVEENIFHLQSGDVVIVGASQLHRDRTLTQLDYIVLQFDLEPFFDHSTIPYMRFFSETENPLSEANYIFQENPAVKQEVGDCIRQLLDEASRKDIGYELAVSMLIRQILLLLLRNDNRKVLAEQDAFDRARLKPVLDYVEERLHDRIQVEEVCKIANMSYYYFVKFFKKTIGMSFTEYVNYRKIKWAERLLLTKDLSISDVGERIGMPNMAHFYKMFKKHNDCSPKQFQRKMLEWNRQ
ncbi:helix-turn-helix domain-containing protein [Paenibacillus radicis (ex Gao et al. 2016)]|uniref:AraC family transcriptional regulator n=2 Tax=Paenibacillus TaxID=44249 RepID=A0A917GP75_9BACL|nr:AraC family transcriptional regulator [Paenibacillus radicis (ex Gao et al. 2016)]GGG52464.1 AraC family transcriptional regulator [Paenibacillus radicis (ex Gao et al. 2016)]